MNLTDLLIDWLNGLPEEVRFAVEGRLRMRGPDWLYRDTSNDDDESVIKALRAADDAQVRGVAGVITAVLNEPTATDDAKRWTEMKRRWDEVCSMVTYDRQLKRYVLRGVEYEVELGARIPDGGFARPGGSNYCIRRAADGVEIARLEAFDSVSAPQVGVVPVVYAAAGDSFGRDDAVQIYHCWRAVQKKQGTSV
ncbi:hypothetical protein [Sorangium sp. So ce385]|uniref:hypothetical protein n=1 Tax=Sorangium sp. So ce385 TaxID=3133308 RepID=UPI003F5B8F56